MHDEDTAPNSVGTSGPSNETALSGPTGCALPARGQAGATWRASMSAVDSRLGRTLFREPISFCVRVRNACGGEGAERRANGDRAVRRPPIRSPGVSPRLLEAPHPVSRGRTRRVRPVDAGGVGRHGHRLSPGTFYQCSPAWSGTVAPFENARAGEGRTALPDHPGGTRHAGAPARCAAGTVRRGGPAAELAAGTGVQVRLSSVRSCITCAAQSRAVVSRSPISATRVAPDLSASKLASWRATSAARG